MRENERVYGLPFPDQWIPANGKDTLGRLQFVSMKE
jgi:hypothetical protein